MPEVEHSGANVGACMLQSHLLLMGIVILEVSRRAALRKPEGPLENVCEVDLTGLMLFTAAYADADFQARASSLKNLILSLNGQNFVLRQRPKPPNRIDPMHVARRVSSVESPARSQVFADMAGKKKAHHIYLRLSELSQGAEAHVPTIHMDNRFR